MNRFQKVFPNGTNVLALDDEAGKMLPGVVTTHTEDRGTGENGLIVRFDDGHWTEFPYGYIDLKNPSNSYVIKES